MVKLPVDIPSILFVDAGGDRRKGSDVTAANEVGGVKFSASGTSITCEQTGYTRDQATYGSASATFIVLKPLKINLLYGTGSTARFDMELTPGSYYIISGTLKYFSASGTSIENGYIQKKGTHIGGYFSIPAERGTTAVISFDEVS